MILWIMMMIITTSIVMCDNTNSTEIIQERNNGFTVQSTGSIIYISVATGFILTAWFVFIVCLLKKFMSHKNSDDFNDMKLVTV